LEIEWRDRYKMWKDFEGKLSPRDFILSRGNGKAERLLKLQVDE